MFYLGFNEYLFELLKSCRPNVATKYTPLHHVGALQTSHRREVYVLIKSLTTNALHKSQSQIDRGISR